MTSLPFSLRMRGSWRAERGYRRGAVSLGHSGSPIYGKSRRCLLGHVISCVQSQLITDHQGTDDQCGPRSATCQCPSVPAASAEQCHINATYQCPSELPFSVSHQCNLSMPISATYQC
ncbi:unnamed protein product, partial [Staurois parvus]